MKKIATCLLLGLLVQSTASAANNYTDIERKEQQRLEKARRDQARRQQDSARFNRENQQKWSGFNQKNSPRTPAGKPGRMLDVRP